MVGTLQSSPLSRSLLEMMLESALTDLKESGPAALPGLTQNALKLLRLLQDFLFSEGHNNQALWSEKVSGHGEGPGPMEGSKPLCCPPSLRLALPPNPAPTPRACKSNPRN